MNTPWKENKKSYNFIRPHLSFCNRNWYTWSRIYPSFIEYEACSQTLQFNCILKQLNSVYALIPYCFKIQLYFAVPSIPKPPKGILFPSGFESKISRAFVICHNAYYIYSPFHYSQFSKLQKETKLKFQFHLYFLKKWYGKRITCFW